MNFRRETIIFTSYTLTPGSYTANTLVTQLTSALSGAGLTYVSGPSTNSRIAYSSVAAIALNTALPYSAGDLFGIITSATPVGGTKTNDAEVFWNKRDSAMGFVQPWPYITLHSDELTGVHKLFDATDTGRNNQILRLKLTEYEDSCPMIDYEPEQPLEFVVNKRELNFIDLLWKTSRGDELAFTGGYSGITYAFDVICSDQL